MCLEDCIYQYMMYISLVHLHKFCMGYHIVYRLLLYLNLIFQSNIQRYIWHIVRFQYNIHNFLDKFDMNLLSNNIHICMMCNYLIFYMYKIYSFDQCKYIVNIVFNLRHSLKDNLHKFLFGYSSSFENILRLFDRVRFLQNILYICLDLKNHK